MFTHYLTIAVRRLFRNKTYSIINILGLSIGLTSCLLIALYINYEYNFDRFHKDSEKIYRVIQQFGEDATSRTNVTGVPMAPMMEKDFTEFTESVRIHYLGGLVSVDNGEDKNTYREEEVIFADPDFFRFFSFQLIEGSVENVLSDPNSVVLSRSLAEKYFGNQQALGKTLNFDDRLEWTVKGIMEDVPSNSHFSFDMVGSFAAMNSLYNTSEFTSWWYPSVYTYVKAGQEIDRQAFNEEKLPEFISRYREKGLNVYPWLQPLEDIRLYGSVEGQGTMKYVWIFLSIGIFILLIACVNFINLSTVQAITRATEVGIRKVIGAGKGILVRQYLGESLVICLLAMIVGLGIAELLLVGFNELTDLDLVIPWENVWLWISLAIFTLFTGILAGAYPAFFLAKFSPMQALRSQKTLRAGGGGLRRGLVIFQFVISISLVICTIQIYQQHAFLVSKSLGFDHENIISVKFKDQATREKFSVFKEGVTALPEVKNAAASNWHPGATFASSMPTELESESGETKNLTSTVLYVDADFFEVMDIDLLEGRPFSRDLSTDAGEGLIINEYSASLMGDGSPLGKRARIFYGEFGRTIYEKVGKVIGKTENFHFYDLKREVGPSVITLMTEDELANSASNCLIRLHSGNNMEAIAKVRNQWEEVFPNVPFEMEFADEVLAEAYISEERLGKIVNAFTTVAILIAALGLFGLAAFTIQRRTKEIGIRKVLGARAGHILAMLNREYYFLIGIAAIVAFPLSAWLMDQWLMEYPYRIGFSTLPYLAAIVGTLVISILTVGFFTLRASYANPADALRDE